MGIRLYRVKKIMNNHKAPGRPKGGKILSAQTRAISPEEYRLVQKVCSTVTPYPRVNRKWSIYFRVLWETGVRASEALVLTTKDISDGHLSIRRLKRVKRKALGEIIVPPVELVDIQPALEQDIRQYIQEYRIRGNLFPKTYFSAAYIWNKIRQRAKVRSYLTIHSFRHGFAMNFIRQSPADTNPIEVLTWLQSALGHKSINSTSVYVRTVEEKKAQQIRRMKF